MNDKANLIAGLMSRPPRQQTTHNLQPQQHHHQAGRTRSKANTKPTGNLLDSMMLGPECHRATSGSSGRTTAASSGSMATGGGVTRQHKLKQRFTVIRKLGKGTYGKVQLAINKETGQEVAIKTIKKTKIETDQDLQRVRREIQIMSSIEHPHIIHIYEVFENKDKIVLVMQYAPGGELYEYVSQSKVLDDNEARRLFRQIATAIFYCHQNKICHRDLKLENILLDEKNNAKLADFGLSNVFDKRRQLKTFCGSPLYASPEIVRGLPYEGPEVDCWSLGVLLYTLVYGAMPFDGSNFKRLVKQISEATYYEPKQKSQASHLIHRLLCANPLERANILEICSDPWVNGALVPMSPRLPLQQREDSNQIQQQHQPQSHNSLLKVAQDMANLTPVRLDILLALRPESPVSMPDEQLPPICQRKSKTPERPPPPQRNSRNELDPQIMQMYQQRQTSPVASYVVRDLDSSKSSTTRMDTSGISNNEESAAMDSEMGVEPKVELVESATELAVENDGPPKKELEIKLVDETSEQSPSHQKIEEHDGLESREATRIEGPMALETKQEVIQEPQVTETKVVAMEVDKMPTENIAQIQDTEKIETKTDDKGVEEGGEDDEEGAESRPETSSQLLEVPIMTDAEVSQESSATSPVPASEEATSGDNAKTTKPQGESATTDGSATDKPKKMVKKKVVVVKRVKKKAAKKDGETIAATGDSKEAPEVQDNSQSLCAEQPAGNEHQPEASQSSETSATATAKANPKTVKVVKRVKGPGKVKIPSTFSETQAPVQAEQTPNPESRRQSTLVADVTEKLLQHRQSVSPGASAAAVLIDQPQLVNVRVSDKKDEFERRASLMAAGELAALNSDTRSGRGSIAGQQSEHENENEQDQVVEPSIGVYGMKTTVNSVSFESISSQEVEKLKPLDPPDDLKKTCQRQQSRRSSRQRLSIDGQPRDERSDSAETIKPEESPTRLKQPTIRSTLKIDLSGAQQQQQQPHQLQLQDQATGDRFSESMGSRAVASGPAPIARSYKKVTFTKDGACITETGKIYSSKNDDGTIRRIERKSKVTHYPSDSNDSISPLTGMPHRREEIQEEEEEVILEGDDFQQQPGGWSKKPHHQQHHRQSRSSFVTTSQSGTPIRQPFERLIMPSSDLLGQDEFSCNLDERNSTFAPPSRRSPFPRHPQHQQHGHQQPTHHQSMSRADSASSCSSGSTDIFDDIFDTWTGAISMFNQGRRSSRDRSSAGIGFNNPLQDPFGQSMFATLRRRRKPSGSSRRSHGFGGGSSGGFSGSTVNGAPRCESVEPQVTGSAGHRSESPLFFPQQEVRHNHHGHQQARRRQASGSHNGRFGGEPTTSGYESDSLPPAFERPASALGSARGPTFGSSNLAAGSDPFAPLTGENPFGLDFEPIGHSLVGAMRMDPFGSNLARDLEIEHENMRRRLMQQHRQIWRGSTPSLFSDASGGGRGHQSAQVSSGPPAWQQQQQQQRQRQQPTSSTSSNLSQQMRQRSSTSSSQPQAQTHRQPQPQQQQQYQPAMSQSSSGLLRQSIALDPAPNRKPTNRGDEHLPPRLPPNTMRKSVSRTSIITNQLANIQFVPDESSNYSIQQVAAGPPRASASKQVVSFIELKRTSSSSSKLNLGQQPQQQPQVSQSLIGSTSRLATSTSGTSSAFWEGRVSPVIMDPSASMATSKHQVITTSESIVSIQQQHQQQQQQQQQQDQGRSLETEEDNNARENRDSRIQNWLQESAGNLSTSSGFKSSASDTGPGGCSGSRCGQLENQLGFKTTSFSLDCPPQGETPQRVSSPSGSNRMGQEKFLTESVSEEMRSSDDAGVSEAIKTTRATLTLSSPSPQAPSSETRVVHHHILEQQQVVDPQTQPQQQQPVGSSPPSSLVRNTEGLHWIQAMDSNSRLFGGAGGSDDLDGADSLSGGGSADLESSSSLLDQLRSRGYRSMINQRLVAQSGEQPQQQQHQHQRQQVITSSTTSVAADNGGRFITTTTLTTSGITTTNIQLPEQSGESASEEVQSKLDGQFADSNESPHTKPGDNPLDANSNSDQREPQSDQSNGAETNHSNAETCQSQSNGQAATSAERNEENEDDEDDDDVDIKRAKANIKGYLERMKETENFLKSIQEAESKFEHQRQQMLLLDNLFMSTKLNGINRCPGNYMSNYSLVDDPKPGIRVPQTAPINWSPHGSETMMTSTMNGMSSIPASMSTSTTAPISASDSNGYMSNAFHSNAFEPTPSSCGSGSLGSSYNMFSTLQNQRPRNGHLSSPAPGERMMSMAMPGPVAPATGGYSPFNHDLNIYRAPNYHEHDPLEPVRPLVSSGIYPKAQFMAERPANYRRSKSQLSDQFTYYKSRRPNFMSRQVEPTISRELDFSSNTFSPSSPATSMSSMPSVATRHRRATSQIRFPSMTSTTCSNASPSNRYSQPAMLSEYQAAYGPSISRQSRATSQLRASSPRLNGTDIGDIDLAQATNGGGRDSCDSGHDDNGSEDEMSSYRPSNYVPKVVPEYPVMRKARPSRDYRRRSVLRDSSPVINDSRSSQRRTSLQNYSSLGPSSNSRASGGAGLDGKASNRRSSPESTSKPATRASWRSTLKELSSPPTISRDSSPVATRSSASRRRSSGATLVGESVGSLQNLENSRLSELEQRIKANQKRREQMLMGRYSPMPDPQPTGTPSRVKDEPANKEVKVSE